MRVFLVFTALVLFIGCAADDVPEENLDLNGDGIDDIDYDFTKSSEYTVLTDRNFDGHFDSKIRLDTQNVYLGSVSDNNFDGVFETKEFAENGLVSHATIDTDLDSWIDLVEYYDSGVIVSSTRYYPAADAQDGPKLGKYEYFLASPVGAESFENTQKTLQQFHREIDAIDGISGNAVSNESAGKVFDSRFR